MRENGYIVVEGPLGVGKSSLSKLLAERINGETILEDTEENPFLTKFYKDPKRFAFQAQLFFTLRRFQKQEEINQIDLFKRIVVSDFLFDKDRIFARYNLDDKEFYLYEQLFNLLKLRTLKPDLVIFLQAKTDVLKERIEKRKRNYEKSINIKYLDKINIIMEMGHPEAIKKAVESGVGIGCLSSLTVCREVEHGWLKTLQFDGVDMRRKLHVISRKNLKINDTLAEFLAFCDIMSTCSKSRACLSSPWKLQSLLAKQSVQKK